MKWIKAKYYRCDNLRNWIFSAPSKNSAGVHTNLDLVMASSTPIKRHIKIKAAANPYDPEWESYFEQRSAYQMKDNLHGYDKLLRIWYKQDGLCPNCDTKITKETGWHLHHRVRVVDGGDETMANLLLLHPTCHQQLHAQTKP